MSAWMKVRLTLVTDVNFVAKVYLEMKTILTSLKAVIFICSFCQPASGDTASRISELLSTDYYARDGKTLDSRVIASVDGCVLRVAIDKSHACFKGRSVSRTESIVDVRVLMTDLNSVEIEDLTGTRSEILGARVRYRYQSMYRQSLQSAVTTARQISDEEAAKYPDDVTSRLLSLSKRFSEEIDPLLYSQSIEETLYCSGTKTTKPMYSSSFGLYLQFEHADELVNLIDELALQCESGLTG